MSFRLNQVVFSPIYGYGTITNQDNGLPIYKVEVMFRNNIKRIVSDNGYWNLEEDLYPLIYRSKADMVDYFSRVGDRYESACDKM